MSRRSTGGVVLAVLGSAVLGAAGGWLLAGSHNRAHRQELFARSSWRRFAALGWLERHGDAGALPLLRDYVAWEREPMLQRRGRRVLARLEVSA